MWRPRKSYDQIEKDRLREKRRKKDKAQSDVYLCGRCGKVDISTDNICKPSKISKTL